MAADGSIIIDTEIDNKKAKQELNKLNKQIESLERQLNEKKQGRIPLEKNLDAVSAKLEEARRQLSMLEDEQRAIHAAMQPGASAEDFLAAYANQEKINNALKQQKSEVAAIEKEWESANRKLADYDSKIAVINQRISAAKAQAGGIHQNMARTGPATQVMANAMNRVQKSTARFSMRLREVIRSALVFTVISQGLAAVRDWMGKAIKTNSEATAAIARLKGALLTMAQPLVNIIIPALTTFVNILTRIVSVISQIFSSIFGTTAEASAEAAESLYNETEALDGVGDAAKKAGKSLASFDQINQLSGSSSNSGSGGSSASDSIAPDFSGVVLGGLDAIIELFTGAALLALGAILTFSGANIALGIGLMAIGALAIYDAVSENWGAIAQILQGEIGPLVAIISAALLVIGAILLFSGTSIPIGLGLMAAGAVGLAATAAANWDSIIVALQGPIGLLVSIISAAVLVIGAILTFSGANIPLGIGLMVAGAVGLASMVALNWDTIQTALQGPIGIITAIVSGALLVLGAILTFSSANIPLGIGLMVAGAVGLAATVSANWNTIVEALQGPIGLITGIVSGALLVLGIILLFSAVGIPLGLGMIIAGGAGLAAAIAPNWDFILDAIKGAWENIKNFWNTYVAKYFTLEYWAGIGKSILDGLFNGLSTIGKKISEWGSSFINGVKDFFGIHSPSTEFESLGDYMMLGLSNGINENSDATVNAFGAVLGALRSKFDEWNADFMKAFLEFEGQFDQKWRDMWNAVNLIFVQSWNNILTTFQNGINNAVSALNRLVSSANSLSDLTGKSYQYINGISVQKLEVPKLASGAVIPPNREFLAVLGDQKSGTNIETPLFTMVQAFRQAMSDMGYGGEQTVILQVDKDQLGKVVYKLNKAETRRIGVNLAGV